MTARALPYTPRTRRVHWTTTDHVEQLGYDGGYPVELGVDSRGEFVVVTTREGTEYRGRLPESAPQAGPGVAS